MSHSEDLVKNATEHNFIVFLLHISKIDDILIVFLNSPFLLQTVDNLPIIGEIEKHRVQHPLGLFRGDSDVQRFQAVDQSRLDLELSVKGGDEMVVYVDYSDDVSVGGCEGGLVEFEFGEVGWLDSGEGLDFVGEVCEEGVEVVGQLARGLLRR